MTDRDAQRNRGLGLGATVGRADLLRALNEADRGDSQTVAAQLCFDGRLPTRSESAKPDRGSPASPSVGVVEPNRTSTLPIALWRVEEVEHRDDQPPPGTPPDDGEREAGTLTAEDMGRDPTAPRPAAAPALAPWPRLRRVVEQICRRPKPIGEVDVEAIVRRSSRGQPLVRLPRQSRRVRTRRLVVLLDSSRRLIPFWPDQDLVAGHSTREMGLAGLELQACTGASVGLRAWLAAHLGEEDVVLVLGDLGLYGPPSVRMQWLRLGAELRRLGVLPAALVPCPAPRWEPSLLKHWRCVDWERPARASRRAAFTDAAAAERRDDMLALLSWVVRLEPALLREVRMALPWAGVGTEGDVWTHPHARPHPLGLVVSEPLRRAGLARLRTKLGDEQWRAWLRSIVAIVRRRHASQPREIWLEEARNLDGLDPDGDLIDDDERERVARFTRHVLGTLERQGVAPGDGKMDVRGWARRALGKRVPAEAWNNGVWGAALQSSLEEVIRNDDTMELPPGFDVGMLSRARKGAVLHSWTVWHCGSHLRVLPASAEGEPSVLGVVGSRLFTVEALAPRLSITRSSGVGSVAYALDGRGPASVPLPDADEAVVATDRVRTTVRRLVKPGWAHGFGRDATGLWASFRVGQVEQQMRWVPPGRFLMGSPEGEEGRDDDEGPQHRVTLTSGYWMADTPCTQALWEEVMGDNPSAYVSPERPVEQVTWDDVQRFLLRLNEGVAGLEVALPTEAQWEYACRAGTTMATYAGDLHILGERNAPSLDSIAWYGGNSGKDYDLERGEDSSGWEDKQYEHERSGTRLVKQRQPNPWGLYDMLGNIYEWCTDLKHDYEATAVTDPDAVQGVLRIVRGGSWDGHARYVRAAYRYWYDHSARIGHLGFRLIRGQGQREPEPAGSKGGKQGRGTSPAPARRRE